MLQRKKWWINQDLYSILNWHCQMSDVDVHDCKLILSRLLVFPLPAWVRVRVFDDFMDKFRPRCRSYGGYSPGRGCACTRRCAVMRQLCLSGRGRRSCRRLETLLEPAPGALCVNVFHCGCAFSDRTRDARVGGLNGAEGLFPQVPVRRAWSRTGAG